MTTPSHKRRAVKGSIVKRMPLQLRAEDLERIRRLCIRWNVCASDAVRRALAVAQLSTTKGSNP